MADARGAWLDAEVAVGGEHGRLGLYGDGGYNSSDGATFSGQAVLFGSGERYWEESVSACRPVANKLPQRYGYECSSVHNAELAAMVSALRWRRRDRWNVFVGDRSALFAALAGLSGRDVAWAAKGACKPLGSRLKRILLQLADSWRGNAAKPSWRLSQEENPGLWNVGRRLGEDGRLVCMCRVAYCRSGMVGLGVKSHQGGANVPFRAIVQGNEMQDEHCAQARRLPRPGDVKIPTGAHLRIFALEGK